MKRGDIVLAVASGDYGKPRPAVIVQSDLFNKTHDSFLICPLTTHLIKAPLFRIPVRPSKTNGLNQKSQIMADKLLALPRKRIRAHIGTLDSKALQVMNRSLALMLGLADV